MPIDITTIIKTIIEKFGYAGIGAIVFAESGLMLGFILPGDSLVFLAGLLAAQGYFNIATLIIVIFITALVGDNTGYFVGRKLGRKVFEKKDSFIFNQDNLRKTEDFFERYGKLTFIIQRFMPIIRAFAPLLGGVGKMSYGTFAAFDFAGALVWSASVTMLGFYLGVAVPNIDIYLLPIIVVIIVLSLIPSFVTYKKHSASGAKN